MVLCVRSQWLPWYWLIGISHSRKTLKCMLCRDSMILRNIKGVYLQTHIHVLYGILYRKKKGRGGELFHPFFSRRACWISTILQRLPKQSWFTYLLLVSWLNITIEEDRMWNLSIQTLENIAYNINLYCIAKWYNEKAIFVNFKTLLIFSSCSEKVFLLWF